MSKANISKQDVISIANLVVQSFPYSECNQINTFALVDEQDDLELANLGKTYQDYLNGTFWSRKWVLNGADPNKLNKQYPILAMEQKNVSKKSICGKESCWKFWFVLLDVPDCPTCKDQCKRTSDQVDCDLQDMALIVQEEIIFNYGMYQIELADPEDGQDSTKLVWVSKGQIAQWEADGAILSAILLEDFQMFIKDEPTEIFPTDVGMKDGARAVTFPITVCMCRQFNADFKFDNTLPKEVAEARCDTC